ncbi:Uncharacterized membrane protein YgdD, TMEM256/DUF423 family [Muriicola jejuensis]|uniref:DUF423 domain-containing protein n=1 Tax=Muriicola jejuensis TaxID=504488 RepID=A0A6P0UJA8_9FLAO|nr:DUF423 domain-containing protein [Muriicola jejuensis]NER10286.1 DUF423 domain-containing protein [Muriicola jejuensis]SMP01406.1 Uncharacterized membrane protein YgdD, TMEM256/DUF423 family [Muriicola jejuensis]
MNRKIVLTGVIFGLMSVILGAFGAHGLEDLLSASSLESYETGVRYQMYHSLLLLWLGSSAVIPENAKRWVYILLTTGVVLFSFSIYLLATDSLTSIPFKGIALLTPLGGFFLILGWVILGYRVFKYFD